MVFLSQRHPLWRTAVSAIAITSLGLPHACVSQPKRVEPPVDFTSLGATNVFYEIGSTKGSVELPLRQSECWWLMPSTLRAARWDSDSNLFEPTPSSFDRDKGVVRIEAPVAGTYTILGLSTFDQILSAQKRYHNFKKLGGRLGRPVIWRSYGRSLCGEEFPVGAWSDSLAARGVQVAPAEIQKHFADLCDDPPVEATVYPTDCPECVLFDEELDCEEMITVECPTCDGDNDGLLDGEEACWGTDPEDADTDGDALLDGWEVHGLEDNIFGFIDLPSYGVDPFVVDVLVEVDWMQADFGEADDPDALEPKAAALNWVASVFDEAGVNLIIIKSNGFPGSPDMFETLVTLQPDGTLSAFSQVFTDVKDVHALDVTWAGLARYCLFIDHFDGRTTGLTEDIGGQHFVVCLGGEGFEDHMGGRVRDQAGVFMHELGHTLGLYHGGSLDPGWDRNHEPNYPSVMNYFHVFMGVAGEFSLLPPELVDEDPQVIADHCDGYFQGVLCFNKDPGDRVFDFSVGELDDVDEEKVREEHGIAYLVPDAVDWTPYALDTRSSGGETLYWVNLQGDYGWEYDDGWYEVHLLEVLTDHNDWDQLEFWVWR